MVFSKNFKEPTDISNFDVVKCWVFNPAAGEIHFSFYLRAYDPEDSKKSIYRKYISNLITGWNELTYKIDKYGWQSPPNKDPESFDKRALKSMEFSISNRLSSGVVVNQKSYILIDEVHFEKTSN